MTSIRHATFKTLRSRIELAVTKSQAFFIQYSCRETRLCMNEVSVDAIMQHQVLYNAIISMDSFYMKSSVAS